MSNLHELSLKQLRTGLDNKEFSSKELTEHSLARIASHQDLNAFINITPEVALAAAEAADQKIKNKEVKSLTGIPLAIKDLILTKGIKTTCASKFLENFVAPYNATVIEKLLAEDAVIVGKTNLDEFAMGSSNENSAFGPVINPWDKTKVPGGSSGGSAAVIAAGLVRATLGTDTGGSIRQPCSFCSITGIKPTYGRISRYGVTAYASSLDQVGPMAGNIEDLAIMLNALCGKDPLDATSVTLKTPDFTKNLGQDLKGLRVGMPKEYFIDGIQAEVRTAVENAVKQLESLGATVVPVSLPNTEHAVPTYYIIAPAEASSNLGRFDGIRFGNRATGCETLEDLYCESRSQGFGIEVKRRIMMGTYVLSSGYYDAYYLKAQKVRRLIKNDFDRVFAKDCDVIASPVTPTTAFELNSRVSDPIQMYLNDIFTIPVNLAGLPALSVPCGFDQNNLPIGLHLIGKAWDEETLLKTAFAYEQSTEWSKKNCYK